MQAGVYVAHDDDGKRHDGDDEARGGGVPAPDAASAVRVVGRVAVGQRHGGGDLGHQVGAAAVQLPPRARRRLGHVDGGRDADEGYRGNGAYVFFLAMWSAKVKSRVPAPAPSGGRRRDGRAKGRMGALPEAQAEPTMPVATAMSDGPVSCIVSVGYGAVAVGGCI